MKNFSFVLILLCIFFNTELIAQSPYCSHQDFFKKPHSSISPHQYHKYLEQVLDERGRKRNYGFNFYSPVDDSTATIPLRPHIMAVHGFAGGWEKLIAYVYGEIMAKEFTRYGYGVSSIEYRSYIKGFWGNALLNGTICNEEVAHEAVKTFYRSISDTRSAINYLYDHAEELGIDTDNFFVYGNSLGATSIMQAVLVEDEQEWLEQFPEFADIINNDPDLEPWPPKRNVKGIVSIAGALHSLSFLNEENAVPMLLGHGVCDESAPYNVGPGLGCEWNPDAYGSKAIADKAEELGKPYSLHSVHNLGHGWPQELINSAFPLVRAWLKDQILCGTPQQESFDYINTNTNPKFYRECPDIQGGKTTDLTINIFPNPGSNQLQLQGIFDEEMEVNLEITNPTGQVVLTQYGLTPSTTINTSSLPKGIYYLKVSIGYTHKTLKWVKQ